MNKTKSWFSKKKNQIDKPINRPIKKKEREKKIHVWLPLTWLPEGSGLQPRHVP